MVQAWSTEFGDVISRLEAQTKRELQAWLQPDPDERYTESLRKSLENTCGWIHGKPEFQAWYSNDFQLDKSKVLWVHGPGGFGKTVLCARIVQHLIEYLESVAHFFFTAERESRSDPVVAARSWIWQIAVQNDETYKHLMRRWEEDHDPKATRATVMALLGEIVRIAPGSTFVADGLDECLHIDDHDNSVARFLGDVTSAIAGTGTRLLLVSRFLTAVQESLNNHPDCDVTEYKISEGDFQPDTALYALDIINSKFAKKDESFKQQLSDILVDKCGGQFLWLTLQKRQLKTTMSKNMLTKIIEQTPADLDHIYDISWSRIFELPPDYQIRAFAILRWAALSLNPLTVKELSEALAVTDIVEDADLAGLSLEDDLPGDVDKLYVNEQLIGLCGPLIDIKEQSPENPGTWTLHLPHYTVKEFLMKKLPTHGLSSTIDDTIFTAEAVHHTILAKASLSFLQVALCLTQHDGSGQTNRSPSLRFLDYAAKRWFKHLKLGNTREATTNKALVRFFTTNEPVWCAWADLLADDEDFEYRRTIGVDRRGTTEPLGALYYATVIGLSELALSLLKFECSRKTKELSLIAAGQMGHYDVLCAIVKSGVDLDATDSLGCTALHLAARCGRSEICRVLLQEGCSSTGSTRNGEQALAKAARNGHLDVVKLLLAAGAPANVQNHDKWTPLTAAASNGHTKVVRVLLESGQDCLIDIPTKSGWTVAHFATSLGDLKLLQLILSRADENKAQVSASKAQMLTNAVCRGRQEVVEFLLASGSDPNDVDMEGRLPLNCSAGNGGPEMLASLLKAGADMHAKDSKGRTALACAALAGKSQMVDFLLDHGAGHDVEDEDGNTPLALAALSGDLTTVSTLLDRGAIVEITCKYGATPMARAAASGHTEMVKLMLEREASAEAQGRLHSHGLALMAAAYFGHISVVRALLDHGVDLETTDDEGETVFTAALAWAAGNGHLQVIKLLLDHNTDPEHHSTTANTRLPATVRKGHTSFTNRFTYYRAMLNHKSKRGNTALSFSAQNGHVDVVKFLLDCGADVGTSSPSGRTPLASAACNGHVEVVQLLVACGSEIDKRDKDGDTALSLAASNGHTEVAKKMLDSGADPGAMDNNGRTPLLAAAEAGHVEAVKLLVTHGSDINSRDFDGATPLSLASYFGHAEGHAEVARFLLENGADVNFVDSDRNTPLSLAAQTGNVSTVKLLVSHGGETDLQNNYGRTPLSRAAVEGHAEVIKILLDSGADAEIKDLQGYTPLLLAAEGG